MKAHKMKSDFSNTRRIAMRKLLGIYVLFFSLLSLGGAAAARAQTTEIPPPTGTPVTMAVYYKVPPGKRFEWLALYRKYHYPVMQHFVKDGILKSVKIYQRRFRSEAPAWDYEVILVWRDWSALEEGHVKEPGVIRSMYSDMADYEKADQHRFELQLDVWIDILEEVPGQ
jgi:hypothetical protein